MKVTILSLFHSMNDFLNEWTWKTNLYIVEVFASSRLLAFCEFIIVVGMFCPHLIASNLKLLYAYNFPWMYMG